MIGEAALGGILARGARRVGCAERVAGSSPAGHASSRQRRRERVRERSGHPAARALDDGEVLSLGKKQVKWIDTPQLPRGWDCGFMLEATTRTLLAGDLFTQGGHDVAPIVETDILGPSEATRRMMDYYSHTKNVVHLREKLARCEPTSLAWMHGSCWRVDRGKLLRELA